MRPGLSEQAGEVLAFRFVETRPRQWFAKYAAFDALVRERFLRLTRQALAGEFDAWSLKPPGALALVLLLDQFPRQIWRDTAMAFAGDPRALAESLQAVERGWLEAEPEQARRQFWRSWFFRRRPGPGSEAVQRSAGAGGGSHWGSQGCQPC